MDIVQLCDNVCLPLETGMLITRARCNLHHRSRYHQIIARFASRLSYHMRLSEYLLAPLITRLHKVTCIHLFKITSSTGACCAPVSYFNESPSPSKRSLLSPVPLPPQLHPETSGLNSLASSILIEVLRNSLMLLFGEFLNAHQTWS